MGTGKLLGKPNKLRGNDLRWTSILSRGSRNTPSGFMLQKPGISSSSYDPLGSKTSFNFYNNLSYHMGSSARLTFREGDFTLYSGKSSCKPYSK